MNIKWGHECKALSTCYTVGAEGNGNPLQRSCLENPVDRGAWWAAVSGVAQSRTWLKWLSSSSSIHYVLNERWFYPPLFSWLSRLPFTPTEHRSALGSVHIPQVTTGPGVWCKPLQWNHGGRTSSEPKGVDGEPSGTLPRESAWRVRPLLL